MTQAVIEGAELARLLDSLVTAVERGGAEALDQGLEAVGRIAPDPEPDKLLVLCAERLQHSPGHRPVMLERLGPAITRLDAADDEGAVLRALAVTAQLQLAERQYDEAATVIALLARRAGAASEGGHLYGAGARLLQAQLELERGDVAQAARSLDQLEAELDAEVRAQAPLYELSLRTLQVRAHAALGSFPSLGRAVDRLEATLPAPVPFTRFYRGVVAEAMGGRDQAEACYRDACTAESDREIRVAAHVGLARLVPGQAAQHLAAASSLAEGEDPTLISTLARALLRLGQLEPARGLAERLREIDREGTLLVQAEILCAAGPPEAASARVAELMALASSRGLAGLETQAHLFSARLATGIDARRAHVEAARRLATQCGDAIAIGRAHVEQALLEIDLNDAAAALASATNALELASTHGRPELAASAELAMGLAYQEHGDQASAEHHLDRALAAARELGLIGVASRVLYATGRDQEAASLLEKAGVRSK